jgi:flavin reductase (DIM6/NTAB) family NADH-FMN oxidoreductase RutF
MAGSTVKAHRLLAPRIAYLIGTRDRDGTPNVIPVSNVTLVSTDPQHLLLAVYKQWRTYETLLDVEGFTLSVPLVGHLQGVWKLGARYSCYPAVNPQEKLAASGLSFDYDASSYGPVLASPPFLGPGCHPGAPRRRCCLGGWRESAVPAKHRRRERYVAIGATVVFPP